MSRKGGRIELTRSGGVGGITMRVSVDSAELAPGEAAMIEEAVQGVSLPQPERSPAASGSNVDRFHYDITLTAGDQRHQLSAGEEDLAADLRQLIDELLRRSAVAR